MRRFLFSSATILALTVTGCVTYQTPAMRYGGPGPAYGAPHPVVVVAEPAFMAFIPGLQIYFVPDISAEIFFYDGRWYNHIGARWYWGISYRGPWNFAEVRVVPAPLRKLPRDYRTRFRSGRYRVPYEHWKERAWETPPPDHHRMPSFLYRVPGPNVYVVPGVSAEIVFYNGGWYNRFKGIWYAGSSRTGPWNFIGEGKIPRKLWELPSDYRKRPEKYERVPYDKWEKKHKKRKGKREDDEDD
ncbi:MAG TPA: hypothetical protein ENH32_03340 [Proteobacteria bacterium]|nr:hypothetical protein [Pseudomonadota bacterium]